jgi:ATP-binding cassette subfamily B protein
LEFFAVGLTIKLWAQGVLSVGDVVLIQSYFMLFLSALWSISKVLKSALQAFSDAKEMVEILDQEVEVQDIKGAKKLKVSQGEIIFQDTVFSYPNQKENVFNKFNLTIPAGQTVRLVGTSGAGKTTITKILLRFLDLDSGKILIDKQDISKITQDSLRNSISYVPQEPVLFHRSIYENIAYAKPGATEKEVLEAAKKAHVDEFVQTLERGYDTMVGERGVKLSGGQKQRVAIARAFLKNAPILVLDEATSALDSVSEELIQDALFKLMKNKTVIVVAHRLSTIQRLDRILVIEEGEIVEDGTHQELLQKKNGLYAGFWKKQTRIFE